MRHTPPCWPPPAAWRAYVYCCERCTLRWEWVAHVCPGCGHALFRVEEGPGARKLRKVS